MCSSDLRDFEKFALLGQYLAILEIVQIGPGTLIELTQVQIDSC